MLAGQLASFWLIFFSPFHIPASIPGTPININGLFLITLLIVVFIVFEKKYLRADPEASLWELSSMAALSLLAAEIIFQLVRQITFEQTDPVTHLRAYLLSVLGMTLYGGFIGFLIAFQLKIRKVVWTIGLIILAGVLANLFL